MGCTRFNWVSCVDASSEMFRQLSCVGEVYSDATQLDVELSCVAIIYSKKDKLFNFQKKSYFQICRLSIPSAEIFM